MDSVLIPVHRDGGIRENIRLLISCPHAPLIRGELRSSLGDDASSGGALRGSRVGCSCGGLASRAVVGRPELLLLWLVGLVPALYGAVEESGFDFGCDVAVDLDQSVGQVMAESFGLGDFWDVVGDKPGFVAVA
jgi:hypothetical protein